MDLPPKWNEGSPAGPSPGEDRRWSRRRKVAVALAVFGLVALTFGFVLHRAGSIRVASEMDKIRAAGEPTTFAELEARRRRIPDDRNSALALKPLLARVPKELPYLPYTGYGADWSALGERLSPEMMDAIGRYLNQQAAFVEELRRALVSPEGGLPVAWAADGFSTLLAPLAPHRACAKLLTLDAAYKAQRGDTTAAVEGARTALHVGGAVGDEPTLISQLVRIAIDSLAVSSLQNALALGEPDEASLNRFAADLAALPPGTEGLRIAMIGERCMVLAFFRAMRSGGSDLTTAFGASGAGGLASLRLVPGFLSLNEYKYLQTMRRMVEASSMPLSECRRRFHEIDAEVPQISAFFVFTKIIMPSFGRAADLYGHSRAEIRAAIAGIDAEKFRRRSGRWPKSLEELYAAEPKRIPLEPFNGDKPMQYRLTDEGCVIYSLGDDETDQGGLLERPNRSGGPRDYGFRLLSPANRGVRTTTQPIDRKVLEEIEKALSTAPATPSQPAGN